MKAPLFSAYAKNPAAVADTLNTLASTDEQRRWDEQQEREQEELAEHNARFDWWENLTPAQREAQIKAALR